MEAAYTNFVLSRHAARLYAVTDSTNYRLKALAREGAAHGMVVIADEQTQGRGRMDRKWLSRPGAGAWFSLLVRPNPGEVRAENAAGLVFVAALAMARAIREASGGEILVKWPNDLVSGGKKLAGIMCEMSAEADALSWAVLGIGVNLSGDDFPPELPWATSVENATGARLDRNALIARFLTLFDGLYAAWLKGGLTAILASIAPLSATLGRPVRAITPDGEIAGIAVRFAPDGALIIRENGAERVLRAGDVSVRGVMGYV